MSLPNNSEDLIERNIQYARTHKPIQRFSEKDATRINKRPVILSCIDQRIAPEEFFGLERGEVAVFRNAGGRAREAVFDIAVLDSIIEITEIIIVHHQNCGLTLVKNDYVKKTLGDRSGSAIGQDAMRTHDFDHLCFTDDTIADSVREDIEFLRNHPWIRKETKLTGFWYEIDTGLLKPVGV